MSILHIRGTNGSGKTTLVRRIMACYREQKPVLQANKTMGYLLSNAGRTRRLFVAGNYTPGLATGG